MRPALTKLDVLIAGVVVLLVLGFLTMLITRHRESAVRMECTNNLRVIGQAIHAYHDLSSADKKLKYLPPSRIDDGFATWPVLIAPHFLKEHPLLAWERDKSYLAQTDEVRQARVFAYFCPARRRSEFLSRAGDVDANAKHFPGGLGDYGAVAGDGSADHDWTGKDANGAIVPAIHQKRDGARITFWDSQTGLDSLTRGQSYTLLVGEKHVSPDALGDAGQGDGSIYNGARPASFSRIAGPGFPIAQVLDEPGNKTFGSVHQRVCNFLFADGSVQPMSIHTSETVLGQLARRGE